MFHVFDQNMQNLTTGKFFFYEQRTTVCAVTGQRNHEPTVGGGGVTEIRTSLMGSGCGGGGGCNM